MSKEVEYDKKDVALSRVYPFGKIKKAKIKGKEKEVTVLTVNEFTGVDDEALMRKKNPSAYDEIAIACGLTIDESKKLARCDAQLLSEAMQGFLLESEEIELLD